MKFQYSEKKVSLPENVHAYAEKKVMKLERFFDRDAEALVVFSAENGREQAELTVRGAGTIFRAHESTTDMFASIDCCVSAIERQIRRNKTRLAKRLRQDAFVRSADAPAFAEEPEDELNIIRTKRFAFRAMTRDEAILQMNLLGHSFFAFRDEDNGGSFAVAYRRNDGGYGIIDDAE